MPETLIDRTLSGESGLEFFKHETWTNFNNWTPDQQIKLINSMPKRLIETWLTGKINNVI